MRGHQNEIRHTQTVRLRYRRGEFTPDDAHPVHRGLFGVVARLELDDGDQLLNAVVANDGNRSHRCPIHARSSFPYQCFSSYQWLRVRIGDSEKPSRVLIRAQEMPRKHRRAAREPRLPRVTRA